ncbi:MAG: hypothetical protein WBM17_07645 [Anaerolineales bacterium]
MEPNKSSLSSEQKIQQLQSEINELEKTRLQLIAGPSRVLRNGCLSVVLMGAAAASVWILPRPIPLAYMLVIIAVGAAGFILAMRLAQEKRKSKEEVERDTTLISEIQIKIKEKSKQLVELKK